MEIGYPAPRPGSRGPAVQTELPILVYSQFAEGVVDSFLPSIRIALELSSDGFKTSLELPNLQLAKSLTSVEPLGDQLAKLSAYPSDPIRVIGVEVVLHKPMDLEAQTVFFQHQRAGFGVSLGSFHDPHDAREHATRAAAEHVGVVLAKR